jgi:hypothetical protein
MQNQWGIRLTTAISRKTAALRRNNYFFQRVPQQSSGPLRHFFRLAWLRPTPNTTPARATQLALSRIIKHERQRQLLSYANNVEVISSSSSNSSNNKVADNVVNSKPPAIPAATPPYTNLLPLDWVLSPLVRSVLPFIGHTAYLMIVSGFLMTDMLQLRVVLAAGYSFLPIETVEEFGGDDESFMLSAAPEQQQQPPQIPKPTSVLPLQRPSCVSN